MEGLDLYVASKFASKTRVKCFCEDAIEAGHRITYNWAIASDNKTDNELEPEKARYFAIQDRKGVITADLCIFLLEKPEFCGALIELGMTIALNTQAWIVHPWRYSIFWDYPTITTFSSENTVRRALGMKLYDGRPVA